MRSDDVLHSFFVPEFSEKLDAVPGITTTLRVTPTRLGNYPAECTELCGAADPDSLTRTRSTWSRLATFKAMAGPPEAPTAPPPIGVSPPDVLNSGVPGYASGTGGASGGSSGGSG